MTPALRQQAEHVVRLVAEGRMQQARWAHDGYLRAKRLAVAKGVTSPQHEALRPFLDGEHEIPA